MADIRLSEYLASAAQQPFAYGRLDCCTLMADWLLQCGLPDAMLDRRDAYATREGYEQLMESEGGIERSCIDRFAAVGLQETSKPNIGDVCLVKVPALGREAVVTGGICVSEKLRAVVSVDIGVVFARFPIVRAWSVSSA
jgi:hypothetical protein